MGRTVRIGIYNAPVPSSEQPQLRPTAFTVWLGILPVAYVLSPLALIGLKYLRALPQLARVILAVYLASQLLPALIGTSPVLNGFLALIRTALMCGLIGVGFHLERSAALKPVGVGLVVVYATALLYTLFGSGNVVGIRLAHPIMTPITLGLMGTFGVWIAVFLPGDRPWRALLGLSGLTVLVLSGSRGPLAAAVVGVICGLVAQYTSLRDIGRSLKVILAALMVMVSGFAALAVVVPSVAAQLNRTDVTGRDVIWLNTISVIRHAPWSGVGSYRLGAELEPFLSSCELFPNSQGEAAVCPMWLQNIRSPWLIAHNLSLQQLAETGPLGLLGLTLLLGYLVAAAAYRRDAFIFAVLAGYLVMSINDNVLLVPSAGIAEFFWITVGIALRDTPSMRSATLSGTLVLLIVSAPLLSLALPRTDTSLYSDVVIAPSLVSSTQDYVVLFRPHVPVGKYRAVLRSCLKTCATLTYTPFTSTEAMKPVRLQSNLRSADSQRLELLIYPQAVGGSMRPLAQLGWIVRIRP